MEKSIDRKSTEENYLKKGDPEKPTYYIIRQRMPERGLMAHLILNFGFIRYAVSNNWIPVVDMQNCRNPYLPPEKLRKENAWEYYFEQPMRIGLEEAFNGENIIISKSLPEYSPLWTTSFYTDQNNDLAEWRMLIKQGLVSIKPHLMEEVSDSWKKYFSTEDKVLGVKLRGTDFLSIKPRYHPIPPPISLALSTVETKLKEWNCNKIFLATEDKSIFEAFKNAFGNLCVTYDKEYVDYKPGVGTSSIHIERNNDYFLQGKEYLIETVFLSMCNSLVAARCSGSVAAVLMAEPFFENTYVFDLGKYR